MNPTTRSISSSEIYEIYRFSTCIRAIIYHFAIFKKNSIFLGFYKPSLAVPIPSPDIAQSIIDHWSLFNQRDTSIANMHDLYPINHGIPMVALAEEYSIPFPSYLDKKSYMRVAEDGMHMRNHDFNETAELVCSNLFSLPCSFSLRGEFSWRHFVTSFLQVVTTIWNMAR